MNIEEALLEIIKLQKEIIELQKQVGKDNLTVCDHIGHLYPQMWHGINSPPCMKCGGASGSSYITYNLRDVSNE